jgi:hypothetical protein
MNLSIGNGLKVNWFPESWLKKNLFIFPPELIQCEFGCMEQAPNELAS